MNRRVVITGVGMVTPTGHTTEEAWSAMLEGVCGVDRVEGFDVSEYRTQIAAQVKNFDGEKYVSKKELRRMDPFQLYAMAACDMALAQSGLEITEELAPRIGAYVGSGIGGLTSLENYHETLLNEGPGKVSPYFITSIIVNLAPGLIAIRHNMKGPNISHVSACATGAHSIGEAMKTIQRGAADVMVAGGSEATIGPMALAGFSALRAMSTRNDDPKRASRPFDKDRDGFVMGDGAGVLVLEELEYAQSRGADILAELAGYGATGDAYHVTAPAPDAEGPRRSMEIAMTDGGINPEDVTYINAHGTSTPFNDANETKAIKLALGDAAHHVAVSSTKSMIGHLLGAAGGVEACVSVLSIRDGKLTPTINYETPDPDCDLDYVPNTARDQEIDVALSNSFGFGGTNCTLAFRRFSG